ncbi:MAG TPA: nitrate reductase cytochrome c-type subunit [Gammaproteobacteria bacterium]|jgi:nitrate reductase (cytochrome), electron transfer subunit|nr:nitrate reductase cytochrome c-type subunit [Gammaproteobacteria bacterium]
MKKTILMGIVLAATWLLPAHAALQSERGDVALDAADEKAEPKKWQADRDPIPRDYVQQPPLIPHKIDGYVINLQSNKCLTCHSWANYKQAHATKVSQTHFSDRDGDAMSNISARRYFCTQCHVPQVDAKPLVENNFKPVQAIKN